MNRLSLLGFAGVLATLLAGCPIYDDNSPGGCVGEGCGNTSSNPSGCASSEDCGTNETCGSDGFCHTGDCTIWGCAGGLSCVVADDQTASCQQGGAGGSGGGGSGKIYCGNPKDCAANETCAPDGTCTAGACDLDVGGGSTLGCIYGYVCNADGTAPVCERSNPAGCGVDADCAAAGADYLCVSGICTSPADQCFDQTQCIADSKCVQGKCTPSCDAGITCPDVYACDSNLGICSTPTKVCTITNDCGGPDTVCVAGACVPRSAGPDCPAGTVWVDNGCIPDQSPKFVCATDGQQDNCAASSVCLHHSCYISCEGANQNACDNQPSSLNQCKTVTTSSGDHQVCGSDANLGNQCNPTLSCMAGAICIDGYCK